MSKAKNRILVTACILAVLAAGVIGGVVVFREAGPWLVVADPLPPALDILLCFGGDFDRFEYTKKLHGQYPSALWIVSTGKGLNYDGFSFGEEVRRNLAFHGYDTSRIIVLDTCSSTRSEISLLGRIIDSLRNGRPESPPLRVGLVSSPYHMRRVSILARRHILASRARMFYLPMPGIANMRQVIRKKRWWTQEDDAEEIVGEYTKLVIGMVIPSRH